MRGLCACAVALVGACSFDPGGTGSPGGDAAEPADSAVGGGDGSVSTPDGSADLGPFSALRRIDEISDPSAEDDDPTLTRDMLELYFNSDRSGSLAIWRSTRAATSDLWGLPVEVPELLTGVTTPEVSGDGLTIWVSIGSDIHVATRADRMSDWSAPTPVAELNTSGGEWASAANDTNLRMVIESSRDGSSHIFESTRASDSVSWSAPQRVDSLVTSSVEVTPFLSKDGLCIVYASPISGGMGGRDLYAAERPEVGQPFAEAVALTELNSSAKEEDPWLSPDLRTIVFTTGRDGTEDIYEATR